MTIHFGVQRMSIRRALLLTAFALSFASASQAADLIVDEPGAAGVVEASNPSIYLQLLGGAVAGGEVNYFNGSDNIYEFDAGWALAGTVGVYVLEGLSLEGDVFATRREESSTPGNFVTSVSVMANAKYRLPVSDSVGVYAAAGLGLVTVDSLEIGTDYVYSGPAYQLILGADVQVAGNVSIVGEVRYQDSLDFLESNDTSVVLGAPTFAALAGVKFGF